MSIIECKKCFTKYNDETVEQCPVCPLPKKKLELYRKLGKNKKIKSRDEKKFMNCELRDMNKIRTSNKH